MPTLRRFATTMRPGGAGAPSSPDEIDGLVLWLDAALGTFQDSAKTTPAASDADPVGAWEDQSGNGNDLVQGTAAARPLLKTNIVNSLPVLRFADTDDLLSRADALGLSGSVGNTVFWVIKYATGGVAWRLGRSASGEYWELNLVGSDPRFQTSGGTKTYGDTDLAAAFRVLSLRFSAGQAIADWQCRRNAVLQVETGSTGTAATVSFGNEITALGGNGTDFAGFDVAELLVYGAALSDADRAAVEAYLMTKYGIS